MLDDMRRPGQSLRLAIGATLAIALAGPAPARPRRRQPGYSVTLGGSTFRIWGGLRTGIMPKGVSVSPDGRRVFVTNFGRRKGHNLDVYQAWPIRHLRRVDFAGNTIESVVSRDSRTLFVTNFYGYLVQALDTRTWKIRAAVRTGKFPKMMALSPDERLLYVSNWESGTVSRVHVATARLEQTSRFLGRHPRGLSVSPDGRTLYVAITGRRHVAVLDARTLKLKSRIRSCSLPRHTALTRDGRTLYVSCIHQSLLQAIDTRRRRVVRTVSIGRGPRTLALSRDERFAYVAAYMEHALSIVDLATYKKRVLPLDVVKASGVAVHPKDRQIYVTGWCSKDLWVVERLKPGERPGALGRTPDRGRRLWRNPRTAHLLGCSDTHR